MKNEDARGNNREGGEGSGEEDGGCREKEEVGG